MSARLRFVYLLSFAVCLVLCVTACASLRDTADITPTPLPTTQADAAKLKSLLSQIVPARIGSSIAYDEKGGTVVLFGGDGFNDTWTWDGHAWTQLFPASTPPARSQASMAYDAALGEIVLFGGIGPTGSPLDDMWAWDGFNWLPLDPTASPPARFGASMTYDAAHQRLVLFGGQVADTHGGGGLANDTWTWDGKTWTRMPSGAAPAVRLQAPMAFDAGKKQVLLFGGYTTANQPLNDTWAWDGSTWHMLHPAVSPPARSQGSMVYDAAVQRLVLFGDTMAQPESTSSDSVSTWEWDGSNWTKQSTHRFPGGSSTIGTYQTNERTLVAYVVQSRQGKPAIGQTWLWDGSVWRRSQ